MNSSEIKNKIIQQVEYFDEKQLEAFYSVLLKFIDQQNGEDESDESTVEPKDGNVNSFNQNEVLNSTSHEQLIREMRAKYRL